MTNAQKAAFVLSLLAGCGNSVAADVCSGVMQGSGFNSTYGSLQYVMTNGPFTCDGYGITAGFASPTNFGGHTGDGTGYTYTAASVSNASSSIATSLGANHVYATAGGATTGSFNQSSSAWGDLTTINGPTSTVAVTYYGHISGSFINRLGFTGPPPGGNIEPTASATYLFEVGAGNTFGAVVGTYSYDFSQGSGAQNWRAYGDVTSSALPPGGSTLSTSANGTFSMTLNLPTGVLIGIQSVLDVTAQIGTAASFFNTAGIDRIALPQGYTYSSSKTALIYDGTSYSYPAVAVVPEPSTAILFGVGWFALLCNRGRTRVRKALNALLPTLSLAAT